MHVLVLNTGSSSLKWVVLDADTEATIRGGEATWHADELRTVLDDVPPVDAVGHRVVHGGARFREPVLVDAGVIGAIQELAELAPLHNPAALTGIEAARARFAGTPQVAVFDTAFHATLPEAVATYALPWTWTERWNLRRYGFHGLSVEYAVGRAAEILGRRPTRLVVCHLGAGCSVTAVAEGRSVDTSMGFTPLEGLMMARRSGSIDPGLLLYLQQRQGLSAAELEHGLNDQAGVLGVSGVSSDMRTVLAAADAGHTRARLAVDMFVQRVISTIGGMTATLGGLDALVFTGGIGEHSVMIRERVCGAFGFLGLRLDLQRNAAADGDTRIDRADSQVRVLVIAAREDLVILRDIKRLLRAHG